MILFLDKQFLVNTTDCCCVYDLSDNIAKAKQTDG